MKPLLLVSGVLALGAAAGAGFVLSSVLQEPSVAQVEAAKVAAVAAVAPVAPPPVAVDPVVTGSISTNSVPVPSGPSAGPVPGHIYRSFNVDGPYIALTFDDGPNAQTTPKLLDLLKERGIKATFFVLGNMAAKHPDVLKRIADEGHEIGNHSWSHPQLTRIKLDAADKQVSDTNEVVFQVTGKRPHFLRPPYGSMKPALRDHLEKEYGLTIVNWSVDPLDWKRRDSQVVYDEIMKQVQPGAIVLAHDIYPSTVDAMARVLDDLIAKGYKFGTIPQLIAMDTPHAPKVALAPAVHPKPTSAKPASKKPADKKPADKTARQSQPSSGKSAQNGNLY
ncbi:MULTISPECIES: polysaccharide deacetylase family protein [unclassified Xanthobacter]|uniref:polysaccharide deacetylase family protein n=1 Tax=unclassified Xanthobacter TaxID=2623496 RepID=UPI001EE033D1